MKHKEKICELYKSTEKEEPSLEEFEARIVSHVMEGGMTTEEFLRVNQPALDSVDDVLNMAMTLESQALDLYLRYSLKSKDEKTRDVLYQISEEEKTHLRLLGDLKEKSA